MKLKIEKVNLLFLARWIIIVCSMNKCFVSRIQIDIIWTDVHIRNVINGRLLSLVILIREITFLAVTKASIRYSIIKLCLWINHFTISNDKKSKPRIEIFCCCCNFHFIECTEIMKTKRETNRKNVTKGSESKVIICVYFHVRRLFRLLGIFPMRSFYCP